MSDENKIPNEEELWDLISNPTTESKPENPAKRQKAAGKFAQPRTARDAAPRTGRIDGFFLTCMAGVAAVSVAATLMLGGMSDSKVPSAPEQPVIGESGSDAAAALERENAELRALLEQQKEQIRDLQADLLALMDEDQSTDPENPADPEDPQDGELTDAQAEAYEIFAQVQEAYADFDWERLDALIPQMDARLSHLSSDALSRYYQILEFMEQPSNG